MPLSDKAHANKVKYQIDYAKKNYKRVPLDLTKSKYDEIKAASDKAGETVNGYIKHAIDDRLNKEK